MACSDGAIVASLRQSDLLGMLGFLREAEAFTGPEPFPPELLERLRRLIPADRCNFCELDRVRRRLISDVDSSGARSEDDPGSEDQQVYWRLRHQHPTCAYQDETGDFSAHKISDFLSRRDYHRLELYADWYRQWGIEYWLNAGLPAPATHTKAFIFVRRRHDFSERDREVLDLLLPHLGHLYEAAQARTVAAALAAGLEAPGELVVLDAADRIAYATDRARRLLGDYTGEGRGRQLPEEIEDWVRHDRRRLNGHTLPPPAGPLHIQSDRHRLIVAHLNGDRALLLAEDALAPSPSQLLTPREHQILSLVANGETNTEIADELWISPTTVRSHLENIYAKLGVHNRTAAAARLRPPTRAKAH
jgi:DNA-binding CsgD family transcriptional regulator